MSAPLLERLRGDDYTCPESMGCGAMKFCACSTMEDAADTIEELLAALDGLERYLRDTPHHNAVQAAAARAAIAKARGAA